MLHESWSMTNQIIIGWTEWREPEGWGGMLVSHDSCDERYCGIAIASGMITFFLGCALTDINPGGFGPIR
jgi:hypothetical protein